VQLNKYVVILGIILLVAGIGLAADSVTATVTVPNPAYCGPGLYGCGPQDYTATATAQPYLGLGIVVILIGFVTSVIGAALDRDGSSSYQYSSYDQEVKCRWCGKLYSKSYLPTHEDSCPDNRWKNGAQSQHTNGAISDEPIVQCPWCGASCIKSYLPAHEARCPDYPQGTKPQ